MLNKKKLEHGHYGKETSEADGAQISVLYHGVCPSIYFTSFTTTFFAPTSFTKQLEVAAIFASDNGIILEVEQYKGGWSSNPFYFNCALLSCFGSEDERLMIGGAGYCNSKWMSASGGKLQFRSIRMISERADYLWYVRALSLFNTVLDGGGISKSVLKEKYHKNSM
eukprot:12443_1